MRVEPSPEGRWPRSPDQPASHIGHGSLKLSRDCVHIVGYGIRGGEAEE